MSCDEGNEEKAAEQEQVDKGNNIFVVILYSCMDTLTISGERYVREKAQIVLSIRWMV